VAKDPWRFIVVHERATLNRFTEVLPNAQMLAEAPLGFVVCGDLKVAHDQQLSYMLQDCSAAIQNVLLAAHLLGLGGCWLGIHPREERIAGVRDILSIPSHVIPVSAIALGYPGEAKEPRTRYRDEYVHTETW
jgi:nitroreductase